MSGDKADRVAEELLRLEKRVDSIEADRANIRQMYEKRHEALLVSFNGLSEVFHEKLSGLVATNHALGKENANLKARVRKGSK